MYTILENARIVISLLKEHNIKHVVVSPGGSNIPIVQGIQQDPFFKCYSVVDERSAMYFAIGLYLELGVPIATSCTSAQATRNYLPGLTEAFYKHVPILAITMSKHPRYLSQDYMQCPIQTSMPVDTVKKSFSLPYISSSLDRMLCVRTVNEAILELTHHRPGPIQLNIEELDNETWMFDTDVKLPKVRVIKRYKEYDSFTCDLNGKKVLMVIGEHRPFTESEKIMIENFSENNNVFIYSNNVSNYHGKYACNGNLVAFSTSQKLFDVALSPDIVITIGGLTGDYGIFGLLSNAPDGSFEHWRVDTAGDVIDTYGKLTKVFEMRIEEFCKLYEGQKQSTNHDYYKSWMDRENVMQRNVEVPFSNLFAAQVLYSHIPAGSCMHFAILNSFRVWNFLRLPASVKCASNVAAFGIDGCLSTMLGQSVEVDNMCFLITGDLSFFYDMNALGIRHIRNNVRILLVNNNGGAEFKLGDLQTKTDVSSYISAAGHFKDAKGWAGTNGFIYYSAHNKIEFNQFVDSFTSDSKAPILFEVFTTPEDEKKANEKIISVNYKRLPSETFINTLKNKFKENIGQEGISTIKKILGK